MAVMNSTPSEPLHNPSAFKRVFAAVMGNALEFYDFTVYAAFAAMIGRAFFPATDPKISLLLSVATFGVGFFARPLGGILIGAYADRFGRKPAMTLTIWLMALGSGAIGLLPTYDQIGLFAPVLLVLARLVQGFSAGGEMGPATTYLLESAPPGWTCFFGSWQLASQNIGNLISGVIGVILALLMSEADVNGWGWRIPFLLGILSRRSASISAATWMRRCTPRKHWAACPRCCLTCWECTGARSCCASSRSPAPR
jgi:MFS family permease